MASLWFLSSGGFLVVVIVLVNMEVVTSTGVLHSQRVGYREILFGHRDARPGQVLVRKKRVDPGTIIAGATVLLKIGEIFMSRKAAKEAAKRYNEQMKFKLQQLCDVICVTEWSMWSICTKRCGGGTKKRTRKHELPGQCKSLSNFRCRHGLSQTHRCNERCPNGGTPNAKGCSCQPGWLGLCCRTEVICEYPGKPKNGHVQATWPAKYRAVATFTCNPGYFLIGNEQIICQKDTKWTGVKPKCARIKCERTNANPHVIVLNPQDEYMFGEEVVYRCEDGYKIQGPEKRRCEGNQGTKGRWTGFSPICKPVNCGDPGSPLHGERIGTDFKFKAKVSYKCSTGFKLQGSKVLQCMASGKWLGRLPTCERIVCDEPFKPKHGTFIGRRFYYGSVVNFECEAGYNLEGSKSIKCLENGTWSHPEPKCKAAICGDPGTPKNGAKDGSIYHFPYNVTFSCFNGYQLIGVKVASCQADGKWSAKPPTCKACPKNSYMDPKHSRGSCTPCPSFTHTLTVASTSKKQCICIKGYTGPSGGPCKEIRCHVLKNPKNGLVSRCGNRLGNSCRYTCKQGYILDKGTSLRTCQETGQWDGRDPSCSPCPINTYKADDRRCLPCPVHSHTTAIAQMRHNCTCDAGYQGKPGGNCTDVNECKAKQGRGPCQDICENRDGGYRCGCSIPGYKISPTNKHICIVAKQCRNLTAVDAPDNGGLVCHYYYELNSRQCAVKCNKGYEFPSRINNYESCGSTTGFKWTFEQVGANTTIQPCIKEFFEGFRMEANSSYFVKACKDLNETEQIQVKKTFAATLNKNGVCKMRRTKVCDIKDMAIICGREVKHRTRRGLREVVSSVDLAFKVHAYKVVEDPKSCRQICELLRIKPPSCKPPLCFTAYKRFLKAAIIYARGQLKNLNIIRRRLLFTAADRVFVPTGTKTGDTKPQCEKGMAVKEKCEPCPRGTFYDKKENECLKCPIGEYQPGEAQTACLVCPVGYTTYVKGAKSCQVCKEGTYGLGCKRKCNCAHGKCDAKSGKCTCSSGWESTRCDVDIPGCRDGGCFRNVTCTDVAAPGVGFQCGPCPSGFRGDGASCLPFRKH